MSSPQAVNPSRATGAVESHEAWKRPFVRVHQKWCGDFMTELRLAEVPGPQIGDHLAEVETHCIESGQDPEVVFGDPAEYAQLLAAESPRVASRGTWLVALISAIQVLCLLVGVAAVNQWVRGEALALNLVQIGCLAVMIALLIALPALLRPIMRRPVVMGAGLVLLFTLLSVGSALGERLPLPALVNVPPALAAVVAFIGILVLGVLNFLTLRDAEDHMDSPLPRPQNVRPAGGSGQWPNALVAGMLPVTFLILAAASWLMA